MKRVEAYRPIGPLNPDGKIIVLANAIDSFYKKGEAKPGQRQRDLVLALFEVNEAETGWQYPSLDSILPEVYSDRYYPEGATYLAWQANQSLKSFAKNLELERNHAIKIANEIRDQRENYSSLTDEEIIGVIFGNVSFEEFATRTRIHEE